MKKNIKYIFLKNYFGKKVGEIIEVPNDPFYSVVSWFFEGAEIRFDIRKSDAVKIVEEPQFKVNEEEPQFKVNEEEPQFKVNDWVTTKTSGNTFKIEFIKHEMYIYPYNFCNLESFYTSDFIRPATDKEIETALTKFAKEKGYKEGIKVDRVDMKHVPFNDIVRIDSNKFEWCRVDACLYLSGMVIYQENKVTGDPQWAKIIATPQITQVLGYKTEYNPKTRILSVGCKQYDCADIQSLYWLLDTMKIKGINLAEASVPTSTIRQLMKEMDKINNS